MDWTELLSGLETARRQLDQQTEGYCQPAAQPHIFCAKSCSNCCSLAVNCSFPEAVAIAQDLTIEQRQRLDEKLLLLKEVSLQADSLKQYLRQFRKQLDGCPFLYAEAGTCSIYPVRPLSCRALLSTRNSSWCGVDFADLHPQEKEAFLSSLDPEVVAFPTHYLAAAQELGLELESSGLAAMREAFGVALSGSLIYQVWLELEYQLSEIVSQGFVATRTFLEERELNLPFLLQLQSR